MSELISGKKAIIALANDENVEFKTVDGKWRKVQVSELLGHLELRIKPRTITINGIEVPAPFEPMHNEKYFYLNLQRECLYAAKEFNGNHSDNSAVELGAWRTEEEIKQVVAALRSVFKTEGK